MTGDGSIGVGEAVFPGDQVPQRGIAEDSGDDGAGDLGGVARGDGGEVYVEVGGELAAGILELAKAADRLAICEVAD